jgi:hypothetical protein
MFRTMPLTARWGKDTAYNVARKVVPTVLGAPGTVEVRLANDAQAAMGRDATVTDVDFEVGSIQLIPGAGNFSGTDAAARVRAASVCRKYSPPY